jgi:N-dimethylarginine dimethylaminohydrolase
MKMNDPKTTIGASFRKVLEKSFEEPVEELKKKSPKEILELIKTHGKGKSSLFPSEKVDYGLNSETDRLEAVLVHRPGPEVELVDEEDPWKKWLMVRKPDLDKALPEYDNMIELIKRESGADVIFLHPPSEENPMIFPPNQAYPRDHGFMTPYGAVIANNDAPRMYEEFFVVRRLLELDIPIIFKIYGLGKMESGDVMYLDEKTLLVGNGYRTNEAAYKQIKAVLENWVVDRVVRVPLGPDIMHLDGVFNIASETVAVMYPETVPADFINLVKEKGFDIIRVPKEERRTLATNWLCLGPGKILFIDGEDTNVHTRRELEKRGVDVISFKIPELIGGSGGPRCMTMPLSRRKGVKP